MDSDDTQKLRLAKEHNDALVGALQQAEKCIDLKEAEYMDDIQKLQRQHVQDLDTHTRRLRALLEGCREELRAANASHFEAVRGHAVQLDKVRLEHERVAHAREAELEKSHDQELHTLHTQHRQSLKDASQRMLAAAEADGKTTEQLRGAHEAARAIAEAALVTMKQRHTLELRLVAEAHAADRGRLSRDHQQAVNAVQEQLAALESRVPLLEDQVRALAQAGEAKDARISELEDTVRQGARAIKAAASVAETKSKAMRHTIATLKTSAASNAVRADEVAVKLSDGDAALQHSQDQRVELQAELDKVRGELLALEKQHREVVAEAKREHDRHVRQHAIASSSLEHLQAAHKNSLRVGRAAVQAAEKHRSNAHEQHLARLASDHDRQRLRLARGAAGAFGAADDVVRAEQDLRQSAAQPGSDAALARFRAAGAYAAFVAASPASTLHFL